MVQSQADVEELAESYRRAMLTGSSAFADSPVERKILHAMIASSAADTRVWVQRSLPKGDKAAAALDGLIPALQAGNIVGQTLQSSKTQAVKQARALASAAILHTTWPLWAGAVVAAVAGIYSFNLNAGAAIGQAIAPLVLGGGAIIGLLVRGAAQSANAFASVGRGIGSLWGTTKNIGVPAETVFGTEVAPALQQVYGSVAAPTPPEAGLIRGGALTSVGLGLAAVALCVCVFAAGLVSAFSSVAACRGTLYETSTCPGVLHGPAPTPGFPTLTGLPSFGS